MWNVEGRAIFTIASYDYETADLDPRCIRWDPKNNFIFWYVVPYDRSIIQLSTISLDANSGMSNGSIYVHLYPSLDVKTILLLHNDCISDIQFSRSTKYFATTDLSGYVLIWNLRKLRPFIKCMEESDCLIAWHPWKEDDIIIASTLPAKIRLINVTTKSVVAYYRRLDKRCRVDAITFNPLSAELVVSLSMIGENNMQVKCEILVMASMSRVVDTLSMHEKSVYFLMWNPDGTQLATAGDDETLNIWNFFGYSSENYLPGEIRKRLAEKCGSSSRHGAVLNTRGGDIAAGSASDSHPFGPTQSLRLCR